MRTRVRRLSRICEKQDKIDFFINIQSFIFYLLLISSINKTIGSMLLILPNEILVLIIERLNIQQLSSLSQTCNLLNSLVNEEANRRLISMKVDVESYIPIDANIPYSYLIIYNFLQIRNRKILIVYGDHECKPEFKSAILITPRRILYESINDNWNPCKLISINRGIHIERIISNHLFELGDKPIGYRSIRCIHNFTLKQSQVDQIKKSVCKSSNRDQLIAYFTHLGVKHIAIIYTPTILNHIEILSDGIRKRLSKTHIWHIRYHHTLNDDDYRTIYTHFP